MSKNYTFRPTSNWVYLGLIVAVEIWVILSFAYVGKNDAAFASILNSLAIDLLFWVFVAYPKIVLTDSGIQINNPLESVKVGWLLVEEFETRYAFTVQTDKGNFRAWAATAPGRFTARSMHESDMRGTGLTERKVISPSDNPRTDSGVALILALKRRDQAVKDKTANDELTKSFSWFNLALTVTATALVLANFIHV
jgi:hypothetical protein